MTHSRRSMSGIMEEMSRLLFREPDHIPTEQAACVAVFFATAAWNESVGLDHDREGYQHVWGNIEADHPGLWSELKSTDVDDMIDELIGYKQAHYGDDQRRILRCGIPDSRIRVEWLPPVAPGVDSKWEMRLHGMVLTGKTEQAIRYLQETRALTRAAASALVSVISTQLGVASSPLDDGGGRVEPGTQRSGDQASEHARSQPGKRSKQRRNVRRPLKRRRR